MKSTLFVTSFSEELLALDTCAAQEHKVVIYDSEDHETENEYHGVHVKTLQGEQERDSDLVVTGPNYIGMLELIELERNVEVSAMCWQDIQRDAEGLVYISCSQDTFGYPFNTGPIDPIKFRLRIANTGDARGHGVRYVGEETILANTEVMVYVGELLTAFQTTERDKTQTGHKNIFSFTYAPCAFTQSALV